MDRADKLTLQFPHVLQALGEQFGSSASAYLRQAGSLVDFDDTVRLLKLAFGERYDIGHLRMQFKGIERALNDGNLVKAQILGLQTSLAQITGAELALLERGGSSQV